MPKNKAWGENSKAAEAKARKADAQKSQKDKKDKAVEDAKWEDDDKNLAKKQGRKEDLEKKRLEKLQRKTENKTLEEQEKEALAAANKPTQALAKITQAQIAAERERREAAARKNAAKANPATPKAAPLVENLNLLDQVEEAITVDEALRILSVSDEASSPADRHPERRMKAAYTAFEEARLPVLKAENPSLRLSQLKQLVFEEWKKSPENPMNKERLEAYNSK